MTDPLDRAAAALRAAPTPPGPPPALEAATLAALAAAEPAVLRRRRRMRLVRALGATAAVAAAVTLAVVLGTGTPASALDAAVEKAKNARSVKFVSVLAVTHPEMEPQTTTVYYQGAKARYEAPGHIRLADYAANRAVFVYPDEKYVWKISAQVKQPDLPLAYYTRFVTSRGQKEGTDVVAGARADRYRLKLDRKEEPNDFHLWVNPRTGWPVKLEGKGKVAMPDGKGGEVLSDYTITDDRYEWDVKLDETLFSLDVPPGYEVGDGPPELRPRRKE